MINPFANAGVIKKKYWQQDNLARSM